MNKTAAPPDSEREANDKKARTDSLASQVMDIDHPQLLKEVERLARTIKQSGDERTLVITGGAGSGKSTLANMLAKALDVKNFDLDQYVEGGFTDDNLAYKYRLNTAAYNVWMELPPAAKGWIVEHVEACSPDLIDLLRPKFAIMVDPGQQHLRDVAHARNMVGKQDDSRVKRALQTADEAMTQFSSLKGGFLHLDSSTLKVKEVEYVKDS